MSQKGIPNGLNKKIKCLVIASVNLVQNVYTKNEREKFLDSVEKKAGGMIWGERHWNMHITMRKPLTSASSTHEQGTQSRGPGTAQRGGSARKGDTCVPVAKACWCMVRHFSKT